VTDKTRQADFSCIVLNERKFLTPNGASSERKMFLLQLGSTEFLGFTSGLKVRLGAGLWTVDSVIPVPNTTKACERNLKIKLL